MSNQYQPPAPGQPPTAPPQVVYVEAPKKKSGLFKKLLIGLAALIVLGIVLAALGGSDDGSTAGSGSTQTAAAGDNVSSDSPRTPIAFEQIIADTTNMTDLQFDQYADDVESNNRADRWTATVTEVDDQVFGNGFYAHLTVNPGETFDFYDISIDISEDVALGLNLGDELVFSGDIKDLTNTLDLTIVDVENVVIHSQQAG